jgi:hypothetical protein
LSRGEAAVTSFWDGRSRALLRLGLGLIAALELASLAGDLWSLHAGDRSHPFAPGWLLALGAHPVPIAILSLVGVAALLQFARGRAQLLAGALALVLLALFAESHAALVGGPRRDLFASGVALLGWSCGLAYGRGLGSDGAREDLAEAGAVAMLVATYVAAAISKLAAEGLDWTDPSTLRALLLSQRRVTDHGLASGWANAIIDHPGLSRALAAATLAIQLGAFLYLYRPWLRVAWGSLLLAFHINVALLTGIHYSGNMKLLLLLSFPWPRLLRVPSAPLPARADPAVERRVFYAACALTAAALALAWLLPIRAYTALHHRPS